MYVSYILFLLIFKFFCSFLIFVFYIRFARSLSSFSKMPAFVCIYHLASLLVSWANYLMSQNLYLFVIKTTHSSLSNNVRIQQDNYVRHVGHDKCSKVITVVILLSIYSYQYQSYIFTTLSFICFHT